jgi:hypothetical protein
MKCTVAIRRPKPEKPAPQIPLDDAEVAALALADFRVNQRFVKSFHAHVAP